ncbi:MAG: CDP-glycerol glycerophosphotransferase family protein [Candidatus Cloacimonetes bacterium]|nr:CDP-glycerol glycerophosphotransferase family protein [Candidatus Cloacimonadota bacterium]MCF7815086.1 CDP-glycerol glycerophosphotransferase family protein [Candidatus Cloacimonadota bacterium]MCF7868567.1 CDP-glycerol glycerophosphotransferase family protein [Candidatus Cloacimonadota bacterium]MCF7884279.1 CDP-glycerol glycerophosphotransferase family protein [Candidatus Cloacimonadota bacterium]
MKEVYYYANNIYQFSYALPVYNKIGGTFVVRDRRRFIHFKRYFVNLAKFGEKSFLKTPNVIVRSRPELSKLDGVIFFLSNSIWPEDDYGKNSTIFHEHGTSDKRYGGKSHKKALKKLSKYDYIFLSGPKNLKRLEEVGLHFSREKLVEIGGLRFDDYLSGNFSKEKEYKRLKIKDTSRQNILYAPTWRFGDGTLKKYALHFAREVTKKHNLIIRPHYHDQKYSYFLKLQGILQGIKHVYFSNASNIIKQDTFNDFVISDLMISDMSSVIYEFLILQRPMIIIDNKFDNYHKMPKEMDIRQNADLYKEGDDILKMVDQNLTNPKYNEVYKKMVEASFYVEGSAVQRAVDFIQKLRKE